MEETMIKISIDINCEDRTEARKMLELIANDVSKGMFSCSCDEALRDLYGGTVFVTSCEDVA